MYGATHLEFVERWRQLARAFTRTLRDGPGTLKVARPDGTARTIAVYYQDGWDGQGSRSASSAIFDSAVLTLLCEDPYWLDKQPVMVHREYGVGADFLVPYPTVSSSQVLGATTVTNPGDVDVWPEWTITGPASLITFTREDTGDSFVLDPTAVGHGNLLAGEQVTVRTDPPQVRYQDGSNWIGALNWPSATLWSLPPGSTDVTFQLDGAGAGSAVDLTFYPKYETA
ncbi:phage tail protein [Streptomyces sp. bgisy154]|uniref:phage tail protein n=1 Tax=Streptomyces sp. bgisy154 TaxID=3413794 RepID=UPI003D75A212